MHSNTVFGHLVHQFAVHPENLATEALAFILRNSPAASRAFADFVRQVLPDCPVELRFDTQQAGVENSIPDMKCLDVHGRVRVVVENKFWAGLTDNQPVTYISELPAGVGAMVLLIVPEARRQIVWTEVVARCNAKKIPIHPIEQSPSLNAAELGGGHYLAATSWNATLDALSIAVTSAADVRAQSDLAQLAGLCRTMENEAFLPLRSDELTDLAMARRFINFSDLPFGIIDEAANQSIIDRRGLRETSQRYGSGSYVRIGGYSAWLGFHALQWQKLGLSPIWVNFYPDYCSILEVRNLLARFRNASPARCFDMEIRNYKWVAVPIVLMVGVEMQQLITDAVRQIRELRDELSSGKPLSPNPEADTVDVLDAVPELPIPKQELL